MKRYIKAHWIIFGIVAVFLVATLAWAGVTRLQSLHLRSSLTDVDSSYYPLAIGTAADDTTVAYIDNSGNAYFAGTGQVVGVFTNTAPNLTYVVTSKVFATSETWTLSATEEKANLLILTSGTTGASTSILPASISSCTRGRVYFIRNASNTQATIKVSGQTGVTVNSASTAGVFCNATDFYRLTANATH